MRTSPFTEMDRLFDRFPFAAGSRHSLSVGARGVGTDGNVTVETTEDGYVVVADLPGFDPEELELTVDERGLRIEGTHGEPQDATEDALVATRSRTRQVHERVRLPRPVLAEQATASYRNGVLEVTLPFEDPGADTGRRIDIE